MVDERISKYFMMSHFAVSRLGKEKGHTITIPENIKPAIRSLVKNVLQPIIDGTGWGCDITSGYRDDFVNKLVGGEENSQHRKGEAADCKFYKKVNGKIIYIKTVDVRLKVQQLGIKFDQFITYPTFVHISYKFGGVQRMDSRVKDGKGKNTDGEDKYSNEQLKSKGVTENKPVPYTFALFKGINGNIEPTPLSEVIAYLKEQSIIFDITEDEFLAFGNGNKTNAGVIVEKYSADLKEDYKDDIENGKPPVVIVGTSLFIPNQQIDVQLQKIAGSELFMKQVDNFTTYWSKNQQLLISDPEYVPWDWEESIASGSSGYTVSRSITFQAKALNVKVWVYSRALDQIFDISPWVRVCSTTKDMSMGSFSIELVPTEEFFIKTFGDEFVNQYNTVTEFGTVNLDWFSKFIQMNDIAFIRFEKLKKEKTEEVDDNNTFQQVKVSDLNDSLIWDMIGLIDEIPSEYNASTVDYSINITGKDLTKLFTEDGSYFIPLKFVEGSPDRWFYGGDPETSWFKRNVISGSYDYYFAYEFQKIKNVIWFVINQLSNIGIVPDDLFAHCAKQKNKLPVEIGEDFQKDNKVKGIWQMIQVWVDDQLEDRRVVDRSLTNPEGSLMDFFNKVCQQPFVEIWGDTWGSGFDLLVRQPPFTGSAIQKILDDGQYINVSAKDVFSYRLAYDNRVYGWYRIMPQNALTGTAQFSSLAFVPIIYLNEYVERFGNKRCITNDIYLSELSISGKTAEENRITISESLQNDLLYVVETSCYLPFTRKGTITLNGDRRIKVGTFILMEATMELFYVTGVNNTVSFSNDIVDRVTVVTVERGMQVHYIDDKQYNYFNIVNVEGIRRDLKERNAMADSTVDLPSSYGVNKEVFDFFLRRGFYGD